MTRDYPGNIHPDDDMAHNVIRAQKRDAGWPSKEEAQAEHRRYLAEQGCVKCDEDDPDNLATTGVLMPDCPRIQHPPDPFVVMCDECRDARETLRERAMRSADERNDRGFGDTVLSVAFYECGNWQYVTPPDTPDDVPLGPRGAVPRTDTLCRCGAVLDTVVEVGDE